MEMPHSTYMTSELKREYNASILQAVVFTTTKNVWKDKYTLIYFTIYMSFLQRIILLRIVRKMENTKRLKIPDTCIVRYCFHFYTGQRAKIPDSPVKYRTPGKPSESAWPTVYKLTVWSIVSRWPGRTERSVRA